MMVLGEAAHLMPSVLREVVGVLGQELVMFVVASVVYVLAFGIPRFGKWPLTSAEKEKQLSGTKVPLGRSRECDAKSMKSIRSIDLASIVASDSSAGHSTAEIIEHVRSVLNSNPGSLQGIEALLSTLLHDDKVDLLKGIMALLEKRGHRADIALYAGIMAAKLRNRDFEGVAATAALLPSQDLTPKMRASLVTAAAHLRQLDEALGHLHQMAAPSEGSRCPLTPAAAIQVLVLAAQENRVASAAFELKRLHARLELKRYEDLINHLSRRQQATICRELIDVSTSLQVPKTPIMYQALASALTQSSDARGLEMLLGELEAEGAQRPQGIVVGEPLSMTLLEGCAAVMKHDFVYRIIALHHIACAGAPGTHVLSIACGVFLTCHQAEAACNFYSQEMAPKKLFPSVSVARELIKTANEIGRFELAECLSEHVKNSQNLESSGATSNGLIDLSRAATMIKAHARERDLASATKVFNRLRHSGTPLSPLICNCYLDACIQCGELKDAISHFEEMKELGTLDVVGYNTVIKAYLAKGSIKEAHDLVREMAKRGLHANKVTYNELLHAKVLSNNCEGIWSLIDEMHQAGVKATPVTCSILLKPLTARSRLADVQRICDLIDEVEEPIDELLFSSVIEACIRIKQLDFLSELRCRYRSKVAFANLSAPTYGSMIKAYGQAGDIVQVRELLHEMEQRGVKPTAITFGCMAEALVANGQAEEAWELIHAQLASEERSGCINTVTYSTVLKGFALSRNIDKVFAVYEEMRGRNISTNTITYNTMLDACAKCCAMDRASLLLEDMKGFSIEPDIITYSTIVKGYCLDGDVDRAFSVLEEMKLDRKISPDEIIYNSILDGCSKQNRVDDALRVLDEMQGADIRPSNYTLSILVKLLGHAHMLNQAFKMVEDLSTHHGLRPNVQVYTCLAQACINNRRLDRAISIHNTLVGDSGCSPDDKFYSVLVRGCLQLHQPLKAIEVVRAAYRLPGHNLAAPARSYSPVGVEMRALKDMVGRLTNGGKLEQEALESLAADLQEIRGVYIRSRAGQGNRQNQHGGDGHGKH